MTQLEIKELTQAKHFMEEGKLKEASQIILDLEKSGDLTRQEILSCKLLKAKLLVRLGNYLDSIKIAEEIIQEFQKLGDLLSSLDTLLIQAYSYVMTVSLTQSEDLITQAENLFEIIKETFSIDLREKESFIVRIKAIIHGFKGDIQRSLELNQKAYELAKDARNKAMIAASLNNIADIYYQMKEYDKTIIYAKKALKFAGELQPAPVTLGTLIATYVSKGDIKEAKVYLSQLRNHYKKHDNERYRTLYYDSKALILKSSLRARDRIKAEDIYKELALDNTVAGELRIEAIINLCDLYITELRITNDLEIINEIHPYIQKLLNIAENQHLYLFLAETYFLQAKLSLLILDLKKAKRFLIQAQNLAESYGLKRLAMKISYEHDELLRQTKMWENLKVSEVSLSERLKLTSLSEQMENIVKRRIMEVPEISIEDPVMLLILTEGGNLLFSKKFVEEFSFEDDLLGSFLTSINYFISEVFSEGLDRAVFGQYTLLMMPAQPFLTCYIFKGASYYAYHKLNNFLNSMQNDSAIWQSLQKFHQKSTSVHLNDIPTLESLITEIFIKKILQ